jgi:hypothetical protein
MIRLAVSDLPERMLPALGLLPLSDQPVVLAMRPDPEPHDVCFVLHGKRPVMYTNSH